MPHSSYRIIGLALAGAITLTSGSFAQSDDSLKQEVTTLKGRVAELEALVNRLLTAGSEVKVVEKREGSPKAVEFASSDPAPTLVSADKSGQFNIRGRLFMDWSMGDDKQGTFDYSGTKMRAAWFGVDGNVTKDIKYKFEADFGSNATSVKDAYLQFNRGDWSYTVGQSKIPNSLEWNTAISQTTVMERASFKDAFGFGRGMGVKAATNGDNWSFTAGAFQGTNKFSSNTDESLTLAARATWGQKLDAGTYLLGISGRFRDMNDSGSLSYKAKATSNQSGTMASFAGQEKDTTVGAEFAYSGNGFFGTAEYAWLKADDAVAVSRSATFEGGYVELGYILTGEDRPLDLKKGIWGRPKVSSPVDKGGMGLWMLSGRMEHLDLTDNGAFGGEQDSYILSLSWYMNRYLRTILQYGHTSLDDAGGFTNKADIVGVRFNIDW
ncbi:hypothetical protein GCM10017044_28360 [Kordiimonas sediminis]|uniref:Porin n=1 Tax=Kordiimonas sediminis TaxID=1735581 RepID=A0A919EAV3_9PROT|nr:porin [Kordiimonas sediminis]GHF31219.1 hypothetical protein GCM10017044_28360 [Kordiimonas sediminis]